MATEAGGLGLLQIPPLDLGSVEVIEGTASALYGSSALGAILTVRDSAMEQRHEHRFGVVGEDDRHRTWFGEAALAVPRTWGGDRSVTYVVGAAFQQDVNRNADVASMDYTHAIPSAFAQLDVDPAAWLALSTSARLDAHSEFGTFVNPRVSVLLRRPSDGALAGWTTRLSAGTGTFAPTPFTEETEATGLAPVALPAGGLAALEAERARSASLDVGGPVDTVFGRLELNATAFGSRVAHPRQVRDTGGTTADGAGADRARPRGAADAYLGRRAPRAARVRAR